MALVAKLTDVRLSEPEGQKVVLYISFIDDAIVDPKLQVMASAAIPFDPFPNTAPSKAAIRDSIVNLGTQVKAALASRDAFLTQFPVGSTLAIP